MAIPVARIGASLAQQGLLPAIGPVSKQDLDALQHVGGLIGIMEKVLGPVPRPVLSDAEVSELELQQLTCAKEARMSGEEHSPNALLGLDALGPTLPDSV
jgi:hypothetical protein